MNTTKIEKFIRANLMHYLKNPNINSVGIGYKIKNGKKTDELAIQFTVDEKASSPEGIERLNSVNIPDSFEIDGEKIETDVIQRSYKLSYKVVKELEGSVRKKRHNPLVPGISIANIHVSAGTLGCMVYDSNDGTPYLLSNWHVLHGPSGNIGDPIVQPGPYDDNSGIAKNQVGILLRSHLGLAGDCAVSSIANRYVDPSILDLHVTPQRAAKVELDDLVVKSGRTTDITHGIVSRVGVTVKLDYGGSIGVQEVGGFEIKPDPDQPAKDNEISMGGDSGALWLLKDPKTKKVLDIAAGLHFAGESYGNPDEHALACNIHAVLKKLGIAFISPWGNVIA